MSLIDLIKTAVSTLKFHRLRAFLTMIGIIIGISSVVTILSIGNGLKKYVVGSSNLNKIVIYFQPQNSNTDLSSLSPFSRSDIPIIKSVSGVQDVEVPKETIDILNFTTTNISFFDKSQTAAVGLYNKEEKKEVAYGKWFSEINSDKKAIVLEYNVAKEIFGEVSSGINKAISINNENFEVIGILPEVKSLVFDVQKSFIPKKFKSLLQSTGPITSLEINVKSGFDKKSIFKEVNKCLSENHTNILGEYKLEDPEDTAKAFENIINSLTSFIAFITGISLLVGGVGVMNIMYVSVSERKREIGIRRAIGAPPTSILLQFLFEAIIVTGIGGLVGIIVGFLMAKIIGSFLPFDPVLTLGTFLGATIISILEGIVFGIIPAYNACKLDPIKAIYK